MPTESTLADVIFWKKGDIFVSHQYLHDKVLCDRYFITIMLNIIDQDLLVLETFHNFLQVLNVTLALFQCFHPGLQLFQFLSSTHDRFASLY